MLRLAQGSRVLTGESRQRVYTVCDGTKPVSPDRSIVAPEEV